MFFPFISEHIEPINGLAIKFTIIYNEESGIRIDTLTIYKDFFNANPHEYLINITPKTIVLAMEPNHRHLRYF